MLGVVAGGPGGLGEGKQLVGLVPERLFDLVAAHSRERAWGSSPKASRNSLALARISATHRWTAPFFTISSP
jgi:hypothetical protein